MRTTLKRGIGRGAAFNGNGHAVLPPAPVTAATEAQPFRRYVQPPPPVRTTGRLIGAVVGYVVLGLVTVVGGVLAGVYLSTQETLKDLRPHHASLIAATAHLKALSQPNEPATALIIGYDKRAGVESAMPPRSDTMMLIRADPQAKTLSMLSFPRDMRVAIHCPGRAVFEAKINAAYEACRETGALETVEALTGIGINYLVTVNFHGFKQIVDKLGGVWVDIDHRYYNQNVGTIATDYANINLWPGYQQLNGSQALDYVRFRHTDSDFIRVARQQLFIEALKQQAESKLSPTKLDGVIGALRRNVEIGLAGNGQLDIGTLVKYAHFIYGLPGGHFFRGKIDNLTTAPGSSDELYDPATLQAAVHDFINPAIDAPDQAATAAGIKRKQKVKKVWIPAPAKTPTLVLNGNGVLHSAAVASNLLAQRGYKMILPASATAGNAPSFDYFATEVYYDTTWAPGKLAAGALAKLFGDAQVAPMTPALVSLCPAVRLCVVVGKTFQGSIAAAPPVTTIVHAAPNIRPALSETLPVVHAQRRAVHFQLAAPGVIDSSSRLDSYVPIRVYPLRKGHKALRLVFKSARDLSGFWGIQETDWAAAPALAHPSYTRLLRGRRYDFYLSGAHVHMVVAHGPGNVRYWVVNTLTDLLTNETMVAIAKSMRAVPR
jgi:LCP family protein required for cell wall assembly